MTQIEYRRIQIESRWMIQRHKFHTALQNIAKYGQMEPEKPIKTCN